MTDSDMRGTVDDAVSGDVPGETAQSSLPAEQKTAAGDASVGQCANDWRDARSLGGRFDVAGYSAAANGKGKILDERETPGER